MTEKRNNRFPSRTSSSLKLAEARHRLHQAAQVGERGGGHVAGQQVPRDGRNSDLRVGDRNGLPGLVSMQRMPEYWQYRAGRRTVLSYFVDQRLEGLKGKALCSGRDRKSDQTSCQPRWSEGLDR